MRVIRSKERNKDMKITTTMLTQLRADKSYYLSNTTGTIKETGLWQWFKCFTGLGDGREKAKRLADASFR